MNPATLNSRQGTPKFSLPRTLRSRICQPFQRRSVRGFLKQLITGRRGLSTLEIKNIPSTYTREKLLELLDSAGFAGLYDFVYLPMDFTHCTNLGYAVVNAVSPRSARNMMARLHGFDKWNA